MKVLVVGYGSIGRRHTRNLLENADVERVVVYSKIASSPEALAGDVTFVDASKVELHALPAMFDIDFAVIANETYKHVDTAILLAERGIHLFIEKPLAHSLENVDRLKAVVRKNRLRVFVAYNLRYLPVFGYLKEQLAQKTIGEIYFAQIEAGQYLPSWRSTIPYANSYSAHAGYGGGVALDLSHEVDYMRFLFGEPLRWKTLRSKVSDLNIDSEDLFAGMYQYASGLMCQIHLDYLQINAHRSIRIVGAQGEIKCDFIGKRIDIRSRHHQMNLKQEELFQMENTYKDELKDFMASLRADREEAVTIDDGIRALELLEDSYD